MSSCLILASASEIRARLLQQAAVPVEIQPARVDEPALRAGFAAEALSPRDQADALAEFKAQAVSRRRSDLPVLGCDQILACDGVIFNKPDDPAMAVDQIRKLAGRPHHLHSAAVLFEEGRPIWRHVADVRLTMRPLTDTQIEAYVARNWDSIRFSVGGYKIEEEGIRLFSRIDGDFFAIQGLPLLPLLTYLSDRGMIDP